MCRDILRLLRLNWENLFNINNATEIVTTEEKLKEIFSEYDLFFKLDLGTLKGVQVELTVNPGCEPKKTRPVPYAQKETIRKELDQSVANDIYETIECSKWAATITPVPKDDDSVRICREYKQIINKVSFCDKYPVLKTEVYLQYYMGVKNFLNLTLIIHTNNS